jgi:hypothetical protein
MEILTAMPPALLLVVGLLLLSWLVLLFLVPFIIEGIRGWTRKSHQELKEISNKLDTLNALVAGRGDMGRASGETRARREPTISDYPPEPDKPKPGVLRGRPPAAG